jgi:TRAP-type C4-dicarboxylate transport system permease small subunit
MKRFLYIFDKGIDIICAVVLAVTFCIVVSNVLMRYCFNIGLAWSEEAARTLFIYMVLLGFIPNVRDNSHFQITLFIDFLPLGMKKGILLVKNVLFIVMLAFLVKGSYTTTMTITSKSPAMLIPNAIFYYIGIFSGSVMILYVIRTSVREIASGKGAVTKTNLN